MVTLLSEDITPCVPLCRSISASEDTPVNHMVFIPVYHLAHALSYSYFACARFACQILPTSLCRWDVAGIHNIRVFDGPHMFGTPEIISCKKALEDHYIEPLPLLEKETLSIMNVIAFSS